MRVRTRPSDVHDGRRRRDPRDLQQTALAGGRTAGEGADSGPGGHSKGKVVGVIAVAGTVAAE